MVLIIRQIIYLIIITIWFKITPRHFRKIQVHLLVAREVLNFLSKQPNSFSFVIWFKVTFLAKLAQLHHPLQEGNPFTLTEAVLEFSNIMDSYYFRIYCLVYSSKTENGINNPSNKWYIFLRFSSFLYPSKINL